MNAHTSKQKAGVAALVMCLVLGVATVVAAQSGPTSECSGDSVTTFGTDLFGLADGGNRLMSTTPAMREFPLATPLPAGEYSINAVSYDGYEERDLTIPQMQEQWLAEFVGSDGSVLATTGVTGDLADSITEATWAGSLGGIVLSAPATAIRVQHAAPGSISVNSVRAVCVGVTAVVVETTTVPVETPTTEAPVAPASEVTVNFLSTADQASTVSLTCGDLTESALGTEVSLTLSDVPAATGCVVEYPANLDCTVAVDPKSVTGASAAGIQNIVIPVVGDANVTATIDCVEAQVAGVVETTTTTVAPAAAPATTAPTTKKAAVEPEVKSQVEQAKTAQAQTGQPAFTG